MAVLSLVLSHFGVAVQCTSWYCAVACATERNETCLSLCAIDVTTIEASKRTFRIVFCFQHFRFNGHFAVELRFATSSFVQSLRGLLSQGSGVQRSIAFCLCSLEVVFSQARNAAVRKLY